jgi:hypothetical protein
MDYPTASSQTWVPTSTTTSSGSTARIAGSTSDMSQLPILGPTDKSSAPTGWCSTLSRSGYTTLLTLKEASGSRNYPMHSGGYVLSLPSTGQSPYFLVYGSEAILPADVIWNSPAVELYDEGVSEDS